MVVTFDRRFGSIFSITRKGDALSTNFVGNQLNTPGVDLSNSRFTGDVVTCVWDVTDTNPAHRDWTPRSNFVLKGRWKRELTGRSGDIRRVNFDGTTFSVDYDGSSRNDEGIRSFSLAMKYRTGDGGALLWDCELANTTNQILELGRTRLSPDGE